VLTVARVLPRHSKPRNRRRPTILLVVVLASGE
jgi:hypothetical protein